MHHQELLQFWNDVLTGWWWPDELSQVQAT
jgi:hypothetical protein